MSFYSDRVEALDGIRHQIVGLSRTVHIEKWVTEAGASAYRPGVSTVEFSILVDPPPIIRIDEEESVKTGSDNTALMNLQLEFSRKSVDEARLREANIIVTNKGKNDEGQLIIDQVRTDTWEEGVTAHKRMAFMGGLAVRIIVFARSVKGTF